MTKLLSPEETDRIVKHWLESSEEDFTSSNNLFSTKSYNWSLFLGHVSLEKVLKAAYTKKHNSHAPHTHNLLRLSQLAGLKTTDEFSEWLDEITSFNINTRYNDYKREFYDKCTPEFTSLWLERIKTLSAWIKKQL